MLASDPKLSLKKSKSLPNSRRIGKRAIKAKTLKPAHRIVSDSTQGGIFGPLKI